MYKNLLIALILSASINCQTKKVIKGCFQWNSFTNTCALCFRRQFTTFGGCGALLPSTDTCLIHREPAGSKTTICGLCRPGYALTATGSCQQINIFNCINAQIVGKTAKCLACGGGESPTNDGTACAPDSNNHVPACLWDSPNTHCYKCIPGYVLARNSQGCYAVTSGTIGCQQLNSDGSCFVCDAFNGYSMQKDGTCKFIAQ